MKLFSPPGLASICLALVVATFGCAHGVTSSSTRCKASVTISASVSTKEPLWDQWGVTPGNTRFQNSEKAGLSANDLGRLRLRWAFGVPNGEAHGQPSLIGDTLYFGATNHLVYSLDANSGCEHWAFRADAAVRTAILPWMDSSTHMASVLFGDLAANVYRVDANSGALLWKAHVDQHPYARVTGTPLRFGSILYVPVSSTEEIPALDPKYPCCSFRGSVVALNAETGRQLWKTYTISGKGSGAAVISTPAFDPKSGRLFVATGNNYSGKPTPLSDAVLALDARTGRILWSKQFTRDVAIQGCIDPSNPNCPQPNGVDADFMSPPVLVDRSGGKHVLLLGQKSGWVYALDPDARGKLLWKRRVGQGGGLGGVQWGMAADGESLYVGVSDVKSELGNQIEGASPHAGDVLSLSVSNGDIRWLHQADRQVCADFRRIENVLVPALPKGCIGASAPLTLIPGAVFSGSIDGHLRAYSTTDGKILWDFASRQSFDTMNGVPGHGGSFDGNAGVVIAGGKLFAVSGYDKFFSLPGNVLLMFSADSSP